MNKKVTTDVDIDVIDRDIVLEGMRHVKASINSNGKMVKHNTGVYFQPIPHDPYVNRATVDHKDAEDLGYFKIDFLNVSVYENVRDEAHLLELMNTEPNWDLLVEEDFTKKLFQIAGHAPLVAKLRPTSIDQLAAVLAIIRPAKRHLEDEPWDVIMEEIWKKPTDGGYFFKKSHSYAYALVIAMQMNLLVEELLADT
jgi:DNA polymerase III alpha subunit